MSRSSKNKLLRPQSLVLVLLVAALSVVAYERKRFTDLPRTLPPMEVYFSPRGGCTDAIVREIDAAKQSILVQAYSFTSTPIAKALVEAQRRGVRVDVILDKSQRTEKYSAADFLQHAQVPTRIDAAHAIAHNKVMIIDGAVVITGSFNFTNSAESRNAENLLIIRDPQIAAKYTANWQTHADHSETYVSRKGVNAEDSPAQNAGPNR